MGEGCQGLKIVCRQRHRHRRGACACSQGPAARIPAWSPASDGRPATCFLRTRVLTTLTDVRAGQGRWLCPLPEKARGGAGTHPAHALARAQHLLRCHQFLIYRIQEKITPVGRGGGGEEEPMPGGDSDPGPEDAGRHRGLDDVLPTQGAMRCPAAAQRDPRPSQGSGGTVLPGPQRVKTQPRVGAAVQVPVHLPPEFRPAAGKA